MLLLLLGILLSISGLGLLLGMVADLVATSLVLALLAFTAAFGGTLLAIAGIIRLIRP